MPLFTDLFSFIPADQQINQFSENSENFEIIFESKIKEHKNALRKISLTLCFSKKLVNVLRLAFEKHQDTLMYYL